MLVLVFFFVGKSPAMIIIFPGSSRIDGILHISLLFVFRFFFIRIFSVKTKEKEC